MTLPPLALYVHMPWCVRKCPYCDFNSHQLKSARPSSTYIDGLIRDFELELPGIGERCIETVFFGGGTPSLFSPNDFDRLLSAVRSLAHLTPDAEITMEANPGAVERGAFAGYRDAGINRVSLGAQSFSPDALQRLGRIHLAQDTERAVAELKAAGIRNFNLDLMYALPEQTLEQALQDVRTAISLGPTHLSHYQLTLEPGTVFHSRPPPLPDDDQAWSMQTESQSLLAAHGYEQYEVSAYAQAGARCRHNLNYWEFGDYVGIGAGAHGKITLGSQRILRTEKPKQPRDYQAQVTVAQQALGERRIVAAAELPFEFMLNALRLNEGFRNEDYEGRTGLKMEDLKSPLQQAQSRDLLQRSANGWQATGLGRRFLNDLQAGFLL
jgi:putative oxygen-independent coproporphyrinogen III oxidase